MSTDEHVCQPECEDGEVYGSCGAEMCDTPCQYLGPCRCDCHEECE